MNLLSLTLASFINAEEQDDINVLLEHIKTVT